MVVFVEVVPLIKHEPLDDVSQTIMSHQCFSLSEKNRMTPSFNILSAKRKESRALFRHWQWEETRGSYLCFR
jgi:hypothetical protein